MRAYVYSIIWRYRMNETIKITSLIVFIIILAYAGFKIDKWFNWTFQYSSYVEDSIRSNVKRECLINN